MAVDLATRPLAAGQSASTPAAYLWAAMIAGPFARASPVPGDRDRGLRPGPDRLLPGPLQRVSRATRRSRWCSRWRCTPVGAGRWWCTSAGMAGLIGALLLQPPGVATRIVVDQHPAHRHRGLAGRGEPEGPPVPTPPRARRGPPQGRAAADEARRLIQQQAEEERRAISAERLRIARDLHDVVAHSMSVIAVQAGVAHHVIDERPEVARAALSSIEVTAREGLVEMRRMLGVLRSEDDATDNAPTTPAEGLRDIDRLMSQFRSAGLHRRGRRSRPHGRPPARARHLRLPDHPGRPHQRAPPRRTGRAPGHSAITHPAADRDPR